jgi:hypothetical protein
VQNPNDNQITLLKEILKWIKFAGMKEVKHVLEIELDTDEKKIVYQSSDDTKGTVELAKLIGVKSNKTIDTMWDKWLKMNLGENIPVRGGERFKRSFDLEELGIDVPKIKNAIPEPTPVPVAVQEESE